jgi:hypothetical protein
MLLPFYGRRRHCVNTQAAEHCRHIGGGNISIAQNNFQSVQKKTLYRHGLSQIYNGKIDLQILIRQTAMCNRQNAALF